MRTRKMCSFETVSLKNTLTLPFQTKSDTVRPFTSIHLNGFLCGQNVKHSVLYTSSFAFNAFATRNCTHLQLLKINQHQA